MDKLACPLGVVKDAFHLQPIIAGVGVALVPSRDTAQSRLPSANHGIGTANQRIDRITPLQQAPRQRRGLVGGTGRLLLWNDSENDGGLLALAFRMAS